MNIHWINILHFYQPPFQSPNIISHVTKEGYLWFLRSLIKIPTAKMTINLSGSLIEQLQRTRSGRHALKIFQTLFRRGQIEIMGSAMYHPILPLVSSETAIRQIKQNHEWLKKIFGPHIQPKGFFLPEMAVNSRVAKLLDQMGFQWIILDEISYSSKPKSSQIPQGKTVKGLNIRIIFRNRQLSNTYVPEMIHDLVTQSHEDRTIITATDGELYGHHHQDKKGAFEKILKHHSSAATTVSNFLGSMPKTPSITLRPSTWETSENDLLAHNPFPLWNDVKNLNHQQYWQLAKAVDQILVLRQTDPNREWAIQFFDRGVSSCTQWWMSGAHSPHWKQRSWNPTESVKGVSELVSAMRSLKKLDARNRMTIEKLASKLILSLWRDHWFVYYSPQ